MYETELIKLPLNNPYYNIIRGFPRYNETLLTYFLDSKANITRRSVPKHLNPQLGQSLSPNVLGQALYLVLLTSLGLSGFAGLQQSRPIKGPHRNETDIFCLRC